MHVPVLITRRRKNYINVCTYMYWLQEKTTITLIYARTCIDYKKKKTNYINLCTYMYCSQEEINIHANFVPLNIPYYRKRPLKIINLKSHSSVSLCFHGKAHVLWNIGLCINLSSFVSLIVSAFRNQSIIFLSDETLNKSGKLCICFRKNVSK